MVGIRSLHFQCRHRGSWLRHVFYFNNYDNSSFRFLSIPISSTFILLSGIVLSISYSRNKQFSSFAKRGLKLLALGTIITIATFVLLKEGFIVFGILHFFGLTSFLVFPFLKYVENSLIYLLIGFLIIFGGVAIWNTIYENINFIWLGLKPENFFTLDYFPLVPWFGVLLVGICLGKIFYPNGRRGFKIRLLKNKITDAISILGKNSLLVYFIHQPIIIFILFLIGLASF